MQVKQGRRDRKANSVQEALFGIGGDEVRGEKRTAAEQRLAKEIDADLQHQEDEESSKKKPRLGDLGLDEHGGGMLETLPKTPPGADAEEAEAAGGMAGPWGPPEVSNRKGAFSSKAERKEKKKKDKKSKKEKKKAKKDKKKKKKRSSSSSSSSSTSSSSSSSVFRVGKTGHDQTCQNRLIRWMEEHPGKAAKKMLWRMHELVGDDGEQVVKKGAPPACAKQFDLRILKHQHGPNGANHRNQREMSTLCVVLDHLVLGRYEKAADVVAARLKAVETANKEGNFHRAQFLEALPVNVEGLTTSDEKQVAKNEVIREKAEWNSGNSGDAWWTSGKGKPTAYQWVPNKGKGKEKKGKEKGKGKKGDKGKTG